MAALSSGDQAVFQSLLKRLESVTARLEGVQVDLLGALRACAPAALAAPVRVLLCSEMLATYAANSEVYDAGCGRYRHSSFSHAQRSI